MALDDVSLKIGELSNSCKNLEKVQSEIQTTSRKTHDMITDIHQAISILPQLNDRVSSNAAAISQMKLDTAKSNGIKIGISAIGGGGLALYLKKFWESFL